MTDDILKNNFLVNLFFNLHLKKCVACQTARGYASGKNSKN